MFSMEAIVNPVSPGSLLDADNPDYRVLIPRRNTLDIQPILGEEALLFADL